MKPYLTALRLDNDSRNILEDMANEYCSSMGHIMRRAIRLLDKMIELQNQGWEISLRKGNEKEIIILLD